MVVGVGYVSDKNIYFQGLYPSRKMKNQATWVLYLEKLDPRDLLNKNKVACSSTSAHSKW